MDLATISDQEVQNDDVVYMVFMKETPGGGWEDIQADVFTSFGQGGEESTEGGSQVTGADL